MFRRVRRVRFLEVLRELETSDCPLRASAYLSGCSTVAVSSIQIYAGFRIRTYGNSPSTNVGEYRKEKRGGAGLSCPSDGFPQRHDPRIGVSGALGRAAQCSCTTAALPTLPGRSAERRVGTEWRSRWSSL